MGRRAGEEAKMEPKSLTIEKPSEWLNCLYWGGHRVDFVVFHNGRRVRVPCRK